MNSKSVKTIRKFVDLFNKKHAGSKFMSYEKIKTLFDSRTKEQQADDLKNMKREILRLDIKS